MKQQWVATLNVTLPLLAGVAALVASVAAAPNITKLREALQTTVRKGSIAENRSYSFAVAVPAGWFGWLAG